MSTIFQQTDLFCFRFKAFKNGEMVYTDSVGSLDAVAAEMRPFLGDDDSKGGVLDRLAAMICSALTAPFDGKQVKRCLEYMKTRSVLFPLNLEL